jgi:Mg2+/citrate symporter
MFLLVVVLSVYVSFNDQKKHGQAIQRPKETWTDNTTSKRNMDRQYNDQNKHGQTIQRPKETWTDNTTIKRNIMFLLVFVLSVHVSFGRCIVCPCFFWSLYCLSMFLFKRNMDRQYNDQKKHGQAIQRQKETWTDNTTTKRNLDRQYNDQKKHGQAI